MKKTTETKNQTNFINYLKNRNFSSHTIKAYYKAIFRQYNNQSLTTIKITSFIKSLVQKNKPTTCKLYTAALVSYSKWQKTSNNIDWEKIKSFIPNQVQKFFDTINEQELILLKEARFEKNAKIWQRNNLILDFLFYSGLRVSELTNIRHCDWRNNSLKVLGKGNKYRFVFLPENLIRCIKSNSFDYLFISHQGQRILSNQIREIVRRRLKLTGIKKNISPHSFRRSFATLLNNRGCKLTTIQKLLGHSHITTTTQYIQNSYEELYQDYSKLWSKEIII